MVERQVKCVIRDDDGDIVKIGNNGEWWSPRAVSDVISDIENGNYWYFVKVNNQIVFLHVVKEAYKKYLRTDPDKTKKNNLDDLPDCY